MKKLVLALTTFMVLASASQSFAQGDNRTGFFLSEIKKAQTEVDKYISPEHQIAIVEIPLDDWLLRAVSKKERDKWLKTTQFSPDESKQINDALDALSAAAATKLPLFKPYPKKFAYGTAAEKEMMKNKITGSHDGIVFHKIGLEDEVWQIVKGNDGLPKFRFKAGYVWLRNNNKDQVDHPYCRVFQINITQQYQGGGTYGESVAGYAGIKWLSGCP